MADNTTLNTGTGGDVIGSDDIAGVKFQRVKLIHGANGVNDGDISTANPLPVTGLLTDTQLRATAVPVSGTFFQATQPVSLATAPVTPVTDNAGSLTVDAPVGTPAFVRLSDGTAAIATLPVSAASLPLPTGASTETTLAALNTKVTAVNTGAVVLAAGAAVVGALTANQSVNTAQIAGVAPTLNTGVVGTGTQRVTLATDVVLPAVSELRAATLHITATAAVNTAATATLPAAAAGLFHYITSIELVKLYSVIGVAAGAGVLTTSANTSLVWTTEQLASAAGTATKVVIYSPTTPLKSTTAATNTTFTAPAQLQTIWRWNVSYFTAV